MAMEYFKTPRVLFRIRKPTSLFFIILLGLENSVDEDATDATSSEFELELIAGQRIVSILNCFRFVWKSSCRSFVDHDRFFLVIR
jgi:hypothetical protein